jgi:nucleoside-diphosphate-sugar epimerase
LIYSILGSSGLIGECLYAHLSSAKHDSNVLPFDIKNSAIQDCRKDSDSLRYVISQSDFVYFLVFDVGGSKYLSDKSKVFNSCLDNLRILYNVFDLLKKYNKEFIFASSQMSNMLHSEYGTLKRIGEQLTNCLGGINVRFWNTYGSESVNERSHVITDLISQGKKQHSIELMTDGLEKRQFLHVLDAVRALGTLATNYKKLDKSKYYDVTSFEWYSIQEIAEIVSKELQVPWYSGIKEDVSQKNIMNEPDGHILKYWQPAIGIEHGIKDLCREK